MEWASKIENRLRKQTRSVSATQWVAEGKGETQPQLVCQYCKKPKHTIEQCRKLKEKLGIPQQQSRNDARIIQELRKLIMQNDTKASEPNSAEQRQLNATNPYSTLQASLAKLASSYDDSQ